MLGSGSDNAFCIFRLHCQKYATFAATAVYLNVDHVHMSHTSRGDDTYCMSW